MTTKPPVNEKATVTARELIHEIGRFGCSDPENFRVNGHCISCDALTAAIEAWFAARDAAHEAEMAALRADSYGPAYVARLHEQVEAMRPVIRGLEVERDEARAALGRAREALKRIGGVPGDKGAMCLCCHYWTVDCDHYVDHPAHHVDNCDAPRPCHGAIARAALSSLPGAPE